MYIGIICPGYECVEVIAHARMHYIASLSSLSHFLFILFLFYIFNFPVYVLLVCVSHLIGRCISFRIFVNHINPSSHTDKYIKPNKTVLLRPTLINT